MQSRRARRVLAEAAANALQVEDCTARAFTELAAAKHAVDWRSAAALNASADGSAAVDGTTAPAACDVHVPDEAAQLSRSHAAAARAASGALMAVLPPDQPAQLAVADSAAMQAAAEGPSAATHAAQPAPARGAHRRHKATRQGTAATLTRAEAAARVRALHAAQPRAANIELRRCDLALPGGHGTVLRVPSDRRGLLGSSGTTSSTAAAGGKPSAAHAARSAMRRHQRAAAAHGLMAALEETQQPAAAQVVQHLCSVPAAPDKENMATDAGAVTVDHDLAATLRSTDSGPQCTGGPGSQGGTPQAGACRFTDAQRQQLRGAAVTFARAAVRSGAVVALLCGEGCASLSGQPVQVSLRSTLQGRTHLQRAQASCHQTLPDATSTCAMCGLQEILQPASEQADKVLAHPSTAAQASLQEALATATSKLQQLQH